MDSNVQTRPPAHRLTAILAAAAWLMGWAVQAAIIETITTADGRGADTHVLLSSPDTNYGGAITNAIKEQGSARRRILLRFDLDEFASTAGMYEATVTVTCSTGVADVSQGLRLYGLADGYAGVDNTPDGDVIDDGDIHDEFWPELVIDAASMAPVFNLGSPYGIGGNWTALAEVNFAEIITGQSVSITNADSLSSNALLDFLRADTNGVVTFMLIGTNNSDSSNWLFHSKEGGTGNQAALTIAVPEPASLLMLGLGGVLALRRRRTARASDVRQG